MISPLLNITGQKNRNVTNTACVNFVNAPANFTVVQDKFLYRGGTLSGAFEKINPVNQLRFLLAKGIKSILCFVDPKEYGYLISEEIDLIGNHNKDNPFAKINMDFLPCWVSKEKFDLNRMKIKTDFVKKINTLQPPIYMHCLSGIHVAEEMEFIFKQAVKEGKILF